MLTESRLMQFMYTDSGNKVRMRQNIDTQRVYWAEKLIRRVKSAEPVLGGSYVSKSNCSQ